MYTLYLRETRQNESTPNRKNINIHNTRWRARRSDNQRRKT